mgnify:CR=1 FL=1
MTNEMAKKVSAYKALYDANTISEEQYLSFVRKIVNEEMSNKNLDISTQKKENKVVEMPIVNEEVKVNENIIPTVNPTNEEKNNFVKKEDPVVFESSNIVIPEEIKEYITKEGPTEKGKEVLNELLKEEPPKKPKSITTSKDELKYIIKEVASRGLAYTAFIIIGLGIGIVSNSPLAGTLATFFQGSAYGLGILKNMK